MSLPYSQSSTTKLNNSFCFRNTPQQKQNNHNARLPDIVVVESQ